MTRSSNFFSSVIYKQVWSETWQCRKCTALINYPLILSLTLILTTGMEGKSSFSLDSIMMPCWMSHLAPSIKRPWTYAPSRGADLEQEKHKDVLHESCLILCFIFTIYIQTVKCIKKSSTFLWHNMDVIENNMSNKPYIAAHEFVAIVKCSLNHCLPMMQGYKHRHKDYCDGFM